MGQGYLIARITHRQRCGCVADRRTLVVFVLLLCVHMLSAPHDALIRHCAPVLVT